MVIVMAGFKAFLFVAIHRSRFMQLFSCKEHSFLIAIKIVSAPGWL